MTTVPTYNPNTYLGQIKNNVPLTTVANTATQPNPVYQAPASSGNSSTGGTSSFSGSTSTGNLLGLSSDVLSLLQETSAGSTNGGLVSALTGSNSLSSSSPLSGLYNTLLTTETSVKPVGEALQALQQQPSQAASPVQNLLNSYNSALNANNANLLKQAQALLDQGQSLLA